MTQKRTRQPKGAMPLWGAEASQLELEEYVRSRLTADPTDNATATALATATAAATAPATAAGATAELHEPDWFRAAFEVSWPVLLVLADRPAAHGER